MGDEEDEEMDDEDRYGSEQHDDEGEEVVYVYIYKNRGTQECERMLFLRDQIQPLIPDRMIMREGGRNVYTTYDDFKHGTNPVRGIGVPYWIDGKHFNGAFEPKG